MAEQIGVIIENLPGGLARVSTSRQRAHGGCHPGLDCDPMESRAVNSIAADEGDVVKLSLPQASLFKGASIMYLLPIAALLAGSVAGFWLGAAWGWANTGSVLGGIGGLGIGFWAVKALGRRRKLHRAATPVITEIVKPSGAAPQPPRGSCCG